MALNGGQRPKKADKSLQTKYFSWHCWIHFSELLSYHRVATVYVLCLGKGEQTEWMVHVIMCCQRKP